MKKFFLVVVSMLCLVCQTDAQVRFGVKAGVDFDNFAHVKGEHKNHNGWQFGPMVQVMVPVIGLGVQPEALITQKRLDIGGDKHSLWYLQVPVHLRYELNLILLRLYVTAGPHFRWALDRSGDRKGELEKSDWGLGVGGGLEILKFQVGLRYSWGMKEAGADKIDVSPRTLTLSLGRLF